MERDPKHLSTILRAASEGDEVARDQLFGLVYEELRAIARHRLAGQRRDHTLQATDLVNEAYLRLVGPRKETRGWAGRAAFFHAAATA